MEDYWRAEYCSCGSGVLVAQGPEVPGTIAAGSGDVGNSRLLDSAQMYSYVRFVSEVAGEIAGQGNRPNF